MKTRLDLMLRVLKMVRFPLLLAAAGILGFVLTAIAITRDSGEAAHGVRPVEAAGPNEPPGGFDQALKDIQATVAADNAKQRLSGPMGDFLVFNDPGHSPASDPCKLATTATSNRPSELNIAGMYEQGVCADGSVLNVYGTLGYRRYFRGKPEVFADAPKDRLILLDVDGHPGLAIEPVPDFRPWTLYVIQRPQGGSQLGILIQVVAPRGGLNQAIANARAILGQ